MIDLLNKVKTQIRVSKNGENKFQKYKYFKLSDLHNAIIPILSNEGIFYSFSCEYLGNDMYRGIHTFIKDDERMIFNFDFPMDTAQGNRIQAYGSTMTYAERYGLQMIFSITDDKDDPDANNLDDTKFISAAEVKKLGELLEKSGLDTREKRINFVKEKFGVTPDKLNKQQYVKLLGEL